MFEEKTERDSSPKTCHQLLTLMLFQAHKTFIHLQNTNEDILNKI